MRLRTKRWLDDITAYIEVCKQISKGVEFKASNQPKDYNKAISIAKEQVKSRKKYIAYKVLPLLRTNGLVSKGSKILSIGCGLGATEYLLSQADFKVLGIDTVLSSLIFAQRYWEGENLRWCQAKGEFLPFSANSFDAIVSFQLLEHIPDILNYHLDAFRILKPNGVYLGITANYWGVLAHTFEPGGDTFRRRVLLVPRIFRQLLYGLFRSQYTAKVPFENFCYGLDRKFVPAYKHHLDPEDLHPLNPFEMKRILSWAGFSKIKVFTLYSENTALHRTMTWLYRFPPLNLLGPNVIATARKPVEVEYR